MYIFACLDSSGNWHSELLWNDTHIKQKSWQPMFLTCGGINFMDMSKLLPQKFYIQVACSLVSKVSTITSVTVITDHVSCRTLYWKLRSSTNNTFLRIIRLFGFNHLCTLHRPNTVLSGPIWFAGTSHSNASEDKTSSWDLWWCSDGFGVFTCFWGTFWSSRWISRRSDFRQVVVYVARCPTWVSLLPNNQTC